MKRIIYVSLVATILPMLLAGVAWPQGQSEVRNLLQRVQSLEERIAILEGSAHPRYTDTEAVNAILSADGTGSGLDADLLDGMNSSDFMLVGEDRWVDETGDTMTGPLNVNSSVNANNFHYTTSKRGHRGLSGAVFVPGYKTSETDWVASENGYGYMVLDPSVPDEGLELCNGDCLVQVVPISGVVYLMSNVNLPEEAIITNFTCFWYDADGPSEGRFTFKLMKKPWYDLDATTMATVSEHTNNWAPANAVRYTTTETISEPTINILQNSYYISGRWEQEGFGSSIRFYGCLVDYDISLAGAR